MNRCIFLRFNKIDLSEKVVNQNEISIIKRCIQNEKNPFIILENNIWIKAW